MGIVVHIKSCLARFCAVALLLGVCWGNARTQEGNILELETRLARLDSTRQVLEDERRRLSERLASVAGEIRALRDQHELNYFEHQRLQRLLKDSQSLTRRMEAMDAEQQSLAQRYEAIGRQLLKLYEAEIRKRLDRLEGREAEPQEIEALQRLRARRDTLQQALAPQDLTQVRIPRLEIEPGDSPTDLGQKADLLKDQEEKLRHLAIRVREQMDDLREELQLRRRLDDLVTDVALFDQQEEALGNLTSGSSTVELNAPDTEVRGTRSVSRRPPELLLVAEMDLDVSRLSRDDLQAVLEQLQAQRQRVESLADSLAARAEKFYEAAEQRKPNK